MRLVQQLISKEIEKSSEYKKTTKKTDYYRILGTIILSESLRDYNEQNALYLPNSAKKIIRPLLRKDIKKLQKIIREGKEAINTALQLTNTQTERETQEQKPKTGGKGIVFIERI